MGRDLVGDDAGLHVLAIGQPQVLLGRHVAQHGSAVPADHGRADGRRDVVVTRARCRSPAAPACRTAPRSTSPSSLRTCSSIWSIGMWPGPSIITCTSYSQAFLVSSPSVFSSANCASSLASATLPGRRPSPRREADVVLLEDLADVVEALVEHVLLVVLDHPFGQNGAAAAHDSGDAPGGQRNVLHQHARVDGHIVHALLGLLLDHFQHHLPAEIFHAPHARQRLIDRHRPDGHRRSADDGLADGRDVAAGRKVHHRIGAIFHRIAQLLQFVVDIRQ